MYVTVDDGTTFAGHLQAARRGALELREAAVMSPTTGAMREPLQGLLVVEGARIRWVQVLG